MSAKEFYNKYKHKFFYKIMPKEYKYVEGINNGSLSGICFCEYSQILNMLDSYLNTPKCIARLNFDDENILNNAIIIKYNNKYKSNIIFLEEKKDLVKFINDNYKNLLEVNKHNVNGVENLFIFAGENNLIKIIKHIHETIKNHILIEYIYYYSLVNGYIEMSEYIKTMWTIKTSHCFSSISPILEYSTMRDNLDVVRYLYSEFNLSPSNFKNNDNKILKIAVSKGLINVIKYLHIECRFNINDFRQLDSFTLSIMVHNGYIDVLIYLHENIGLNKEDFSINNNVILMKAICGAHMDVVAYLIDKIGLNLNNNDYFISMKNNEKRTSLSKILDTHKH